ncbi:phosphatidylinositol 4-kinase family protein [Cyclospora cayetanensis]|uniref:1-phosphatidylinositol 4-kinase n=1 Tax=Cyclospora cayetanensis TaxID=88456 RepID=A0A1D3CRP9_9EIME|nr:phosphatidylinositol 4-kinase family protein [Cyclospora cayetanensis]
MILTLLTAQQQRKRGAILLEDVLNGQEDKQYPLQTPAVGRGAAHSRMRQLQQQERLQEGERSAAAERDLKDGPTPSRGCRSIRRSGGDCRVCAWKPCMQPPRKPPEASRQRQLPPLRMLPRRRRRTRSEFFDAHFHLYYLFNRKEQGVHQYLVNLLYTKRDINEINFYLPQLCQLALTRFNSSPLSRFLLDVCSTHIHFALRAAWLFQSFVEDKISGLEEAAQKMTQEVEMALVNSKPLAHAVCCTSMLPTTEQYPLLPPRLPSVFSHNTGLVSVPGARAKLPSVYAKLGNPLSLTTLSPPNLCCGTCNRASSSTGSGKGCTDSCVAVELHQFVMKQRRCDYFNGLNHFVSLLIDASNILAAEPDRSIRRLFVAANGGDFSLAGLTVPLEQIGAEPMHNSSSYGMTPRHSAGSGHRLLHSSSFPAAAAAPPPLPAVQLLRIESRDSRTLSSKKRAPYLLIIEVCNLDEGVYLDGLSLGARVALVDSFFLLLHQAAPHGGDLDQFSDDPEVQKEEVKSKPLFVYQCILKELKQRKMLPPKAPAGEDPVTAIRRVLGMLPQSPTPCVASLEADTPNRAAKAACSPTAETHMRLQQPGEDDTAPWRPQSPSSETASAPNMAAVSGGTETAAAGGAALRLSENHFVKQESRRAPGGGPPAHTAKCNSLWGELWVARRERLRRKSPYGKLRSWDIKCILVKGGDDLRQELLASQLVRQFKAIFEEARLPLWLRPYEILVTGSNSGIMECIPDTCSVDLLKKKHGVDSIATVFDTLFSDNPFEAKKNFIESHAAYSLVSYLLQVKDRHNGNLLLDAEGHVIHIGCLLVVQEFLDVMDGETSDNYEYFRTLIIRGFLEARKHADRIILMVEMMLSGKLPFHKLNRLSALTPTKMPCFSGGPEYTLSALKERFMLGLAEDACIERVVELIDISVNNFRTVQYDNFQRITNGIM